MRNWFRVVGFLACLLAMVSAAAAAEISGRYFVAIGHSPEFVMEISQAGSAVEFSLVGSGVRIEGEGTVVERKVTLVADLGEGEKFVAVIEFSEDSTSFSGGWEVPGDRPSQGTITGTTRPWSTWDLNSLGLPTFGEVDCIELNKIGRISRFRSGAGHDYSDDFESCRSMKHYYDPRDGVDRMSVRLFSPVSGTVIGTTDEWDGPDVWKGKALGVRPHRYPAFDVVIFHVNLDRELRPGDRVRAGEQLGTSQKQLGTVTDVAVGVHTPQGYRRVSFFEIIEEHVFRRYRMSGAGSQAELVIPREERDSDPLTCEGEEFVDGGNLENWVTLTGLPAPRRPSPGRATP